MERKYVGCVGRLFTRLSLFTGDFDIIILRLAKTVSRNWYTRWGSEWQFYLQVGWRPMHGDQRSRGRRLRHWSVTKQRVS